MINNSIQDLSGEEITRFLQELNLDAKKANSLTIEEIKIAYRKRAKETHPDLGGNENDFKAVNHAYQMITNPEYRHKNRTVKAPFGLNVDLQVGCSFEDAFFGRALNVTIHQIKATDEGVYDLEAAQKDGKTEIHTFTITINVPPGSVNGFQTTRAGLGIQVAGRKGDLRIRITPNPKPGVMIRNDEYGQPIDVITQVPVTLATMLKGGKIQVLTMYGLKTVWVAPGTAPGGQIAIKNCGVNKRGAHIVIVQPIFPTQQELHDKSWMPLGINWQDHEDEIKKEEKEYDDWAKAFTTKFEPKKE